MKECPSCYQMNEDSANFCRFCGSPLPSNTHDNTQYTYDDTEPVAYSSENPAKKKLSAPVIAGICVALAVLLGGGGYALLSNMNGSNDPEEPVAAVSSSSSSTASSAVSSTSDSSKESKADSEEKEEKASSEKAEETSKETSKASSQEKAPASEKPSSDVEDLGMPKYDGYTVYKTNAVMKVRSEPSTSAAQIGRIPEGGQAVVDATCNTGGGVWGRLKDAQGWVCISDATSNYLTAQSIPNAAQIAAPTSQPTQPIYLTYTLSYDMNIRSAPSYDASIVGHAKAGENVDIDNYEDGTNQSQWGRIRGTNNWVCISDADFVYMRH